MAVYPHGCGSLVADRGGDNMISLLLDFNLSHGEKLSLDSHCHLAPEVVKTVI